MKRQEEVIAVEGLKIQRYLYRPPTAPRGSVLLFHGQGDFVTRYEEVIAVFLEHGLAVIAADLPGHGATPGRRGHVPGFGFIEALTEVLSEELANQDFPKFRGVVGHSCGGLLALHSFLDSPEDWDFGWVSSPLIKPEASQTAFKALLLRLASRLVPSLSVDTGVDLDDCLQPESEGAILAREQLGDHNNHFHSRITLSWAREITERAEELRKELAESPPQVPFLITQGEEDRVCPPEEIRSIVAAAGSSGFNYQEFPGLRHEPFADTSRLPVLQALSDFLRKTLNQATSPSG